MDWIDINKVHPDAIIDWRHKDEESLLVVVHYEGGFSSDIKVEEIAHPGLRKSEYGVSDDGFSYTGAMKRISHWMLLPSLPREDTS